MLYNQQPFNLIVIHFKFNTFLMYLSEIFYGTEFSKINLTTVLNLKFQEL